MQNPGQTRIFYKAGQTQMTCRKVTQMTRITRMTRPGCNADIYTESYYFFNSNILVLYDSYMTSILNDF